MKVVRTGRARIWGALSSVSICAIVSGCSSSTDETAEFAFTISGEDSAIDGFAFPPSGEEAAFVDGWEVTFERIIVTVGDIVLTERPDSSPVDQSITGEVVARARGPWAVDVSKAGSSLDPPVAAASFGTNGNVRLTHGGAHDVPVTGRGSASDRAIRLVRMPNKNVAGGGAFDTSARYGFGYDLLAATASAERVNLDASGQRDYDEMIAKGWSALYVGTATFRGVDCRASSMASFDNVAKKVNFRFGFATPTQYINCQNSDLSGTPFEGEEKQRGVQAKAGTLSYQQLTLHLEHPFFDTTAHDEAKPFFDQIAVAAKDGNVTLDDLASVDPTTFRLDATTKLPWRSCISDVPPKAGDRVFDSGSLAINPGGAPESTLRNYADYMRYSESTMGHLNADGLCATKRNYPSPR